MTTRLDNATVRMIAQRTLWKFRSWGFQALLLIGPRRNHKGIMIAVLSPEERAQEFIDGTVQALELIEHTDSTIFSAVRHNLRKIVLIAGGGETYVHELRSYLVDVKEFSSKSVLEVASSIVHEATHAQLASDGTSYDARSRSKIEHICVGAEIRFLRLAGGSPEMIAGKQTALDTEWWSDESLAQRRHEQLVAHGVPKFLANLVKRQR